MSDPMSSRDDNSGGRNDNRPRRNSDRNNRDNRNSRDNRNNRNGKRPENGEGGDPNKPGRNSQLVMILVIAGVLTLIMASLMSSYFTDSSSTEVAYSEFIEMLENGEIDTVIISTYEIEFTLVEDTEALYDSDDSSILYYYATESYYTVKVDDDGLVDRLLEAGVNIIGEETNTSSTLLDILLIYILPVVLIWALIMYMMKRSGGGSVMGVGKSNAKMYDMQKETGVTFKDVAGEDEAKESLQEIVDFLHNPGKYSTIGARLPKGALLVGPPGTGKTLLAKAVAGEAQVPFLSLSGSDFVEMFVGVGASRVRDLFKKAKDNAPCIIFIDEIDAIGKSRDSRYGGGNDEREQTLNQLLSEMDGFESNKGVFILAATNRPEILDKALLRPGRLDRRIIVDKPDLKGRVDILKVHSKDVLMDESVDLEAIALATSGAVGSDLANMINEAAITAVKKGRKVVTQSDLFEAVEVVLVGKEKKDRIMSEKERRIVSYHEVGHALVSALQKDSEPVQKITIVPRTMGALGYVMNVPEEEKYLNTEAELKAMLVQLLGGRAAEELVFDTVTTGAANDIEKATKLARAMVTQYGMSKRFGLMGLESIESQYLDGRPVQNCSDVTAAQIDDEVKEMLEEAHDEALALLADNRDALDRIAEFLIERETITGAEFMEIFRKIQAERVASEEEPPKVDTVEVIYLESAPDGGQPSADAAEGVGISEQDVPDA